MMEVTHVVKRCPLCSGDVEVAVYKEKYSSYAEIYWSECDHDRHEITEKNKYFFEDAIGESTEEMI